MRPQFKRRATLGALAIAVGVGVGVGGCGSSSGGGSQADPASVVPASAPVYLSAVVRPNGTLASNALAAARTITGVSNPVDALLRLFERRGHIDYATQVRPWLGSQIGVFFTRPPKLSSASIVAGLSSAGGALVADTTNSARSRTFLNAQLRADVGANTRSASYRGVSYQTGSNEAAAIVKGLAVIGTPAGVRSVIATAGGQPALAGASGWQRSAGGALGGGAIARGYLNLDTLLAAVGNAASSATNGAELAIVRQVLDQIGLNAIGLVLTPQPHALTLDVLVPGSLGASGSVAGSGSAVLAGLPADAWGAVGLGNLGALINKALQSITGTGAAGALVLPAIFSALDGLLDGVDLQHDVLPWLGNTGLLISGTSLQHPEEAVVAQSTDPAASRAAVARIEATLRGVRGGQVAPAHVAGADAGFAFRPPHSSVTIDVVDGNGRFAVAVGDRAAAEALRPSATLGSTSAFRAASAALGAGIPPSALLSMPSLLRVLDTTPLARNRGFRAAEPYLHAFTEIVLGAQHSAGVERVRIVAGLR